jgi:hypothetical protein
MIFGSGPFVTVMSRTSSIRLRSRGAVVDAAQSLGRSPASWRNLSLLLGRHRPRDLPLEGSQLCFELLQALHGIVPALFKCRCYQTITRINRFITSFG